ncbi:hypothetical protein [Streptomyces sp. TLI_171]|uniref:hypothetical protein n=1 Tax=Streptomyces sp. TLI_171 TaxID=1938859 RepID=UPI000C1993C7|nr:hypothetical protein [Streptomyces sp. TLI_171]RKE22994.1 hypothetical protein BX266_6450 [Streptomyces sp. TLI_171]
MTESSLRLVRRLPLRGLYPPGYRAAHGDEIVDALAEAVQHADRRTALREWAVLAAHALRLRTGLGSSDPAGRILAGAAPFLLAGGAALSAVHLLTALLLHQPHSGVGPAAWDAARAAPWVLGLLCAGAGRWTAARALVLVGLVLRCGFAVVASFHFGSSLAPYLVWLWAACGVLVLLAPPDAVELTRRDRSRLVATAVAVALPMSATAILWIGTWHDDYDQVIFAPTFVLLFYAVAAWPALVIALSCLRHLTRPGADRLRAAGVALAVLPWTVPVAAPLYRSAHADAHDLLRQGGAILALLATVTAVAVLRRTAERPTPK